MILNISTQPVNILYSPLFWFLDEKREQTQRPTPKNFRDCYVEKCSRNQMPGDMEKRLCAEFLGGLGIIGGGLLWLYGHFKEKSFLKYVGGLVSFSGIGSLVTGLIKFNTLGFKSLFDIKSENQSPTNNPTENNNSPTPESSNTTPEPEKENITINPDAVVSENYSKNFALIVVNNPDASKEESLNKSEEIKLDFSNLKSPSFLTQTGRIAYGVLSFIQRKANENQEILNDPAVQIFTYAVGGKYLFLALNIFGIYQEFKKGDFKFKTEDGKEYSYDEFTKTFTQEEQYKKACEVVGVNPSEIDGKEEKEAKDLVKKAWRKKAFQYHPDRNPGDKEAENNFKNLSVAIEEICLYKGWDVKGL